MRSLKAGRVITGYGNAFYLLAVRILNNRDYLTAKYKEESIMADLNWKKSGLFAAGVLFGTAGIKALSSKDAKKLYTNCTAAVLRAKDCVMKTVTTVQENCGDIYEGAKQINEDRAAAEETFEDTADEEVKTDQEVKAEEDKTEEDTFKEAE